MALFIFQWKNSLSKELRTIDKYYIFQKKNLTFQIGKDTTEVPQYLLKKALA